MTDIYWMEKNDPKPNTGTDNDFINMIMMKNGPKPMPMPLPMPMPMPSSNVFSNGNDIYFYSEINMGSAIKFHNEITKVYNSTVMNMELMKIKGFTINFPPIVIHINSPGGSIFSAFLMMDRMRSLKQKDPRVMIHTVVEGTCVSAATLISVCGDKRFIMKHGLMLIHQLKSQTWGKYNEIKDEMTNLDLLMKKIKKIYKLHTKIPANTMDEILKHDLLWGSKKCLNLGMVDSII